jgi:hypothetical protein
VSWERIDGASDQILPSAALRSRQGSRARRGGGKLSPVGSATSSDGEVDALRAADNEAAVELADAVVEAR